MIGPASLCLLLVVAPAVAAAQSAQSAQPRQSPALTIEQAVALAMENNRQVRNAELEVAKAEDRIAAARTQYFPGLKFFLIEGYLFTPFDLKVDKGTFGTFASTGPIPPEDTTIRTPRGAVTIIDAAVLQPLSQLYRIGLFNRMLDVGREIAREELRGQRQTTANEVRRAYYGLIQTESALGAIEGALAFLRELDQLVTRYVEQQVALKSEGLDVKARLAKTEHDALTLRHAHASQHEQLNYLLGRDLDTEFSVVPVPDVTLPEADLQAARLRAIDQRPELRAARLRLTQAEYDARIKKAEYIPDVSLMFNYLGNPDVAFFPTHIAGVGLVLTWDVWDWGKKGSELAEKRKTIEQVRNGLQDAEPRILLDLGTKFRKLQEARALLQVSELSRDAAREKVRVALDKYGQQAVLLKDVLQTQAALGEANAQYEQTLSGFWAARADFQKALGEE